MAGAATARQHRWRGWRRFALLTTGLYPVVFMFPLAATTAPVEPSIALWALPTIAVGIAALQSHSADSVPMTIKEQLGQAVGDGR